MSDEDKTKKELMEDINKLRERILDLQDKAIELRESKQTIARIKDSLANAQRIARLGNWDWDIVANELFWSDEIFRIFGLSKDEFEATYEAFLKAVHPDDRQFVMDSVDKALEDGDNYSIDHRIVHPDGTVKTVHEQAEVVFDSSGRPFRMSGTVQDVTKQRRIENEVSVLAKVPLENPNPILRIDREGKLVYANPASEALLADRGWSIGSSVSDEWKAFVRECYGKGVNLEKEAELQTTIYSFFFAPIGDAGYVNAYGLDITGRKKAEVELRKISAVIECSINVVFITDKDGVIEYVNPMFVETTGYTQVDAIGQTPRILSSGDVPDSEYKELWRTINSGRTWYGLFKNKRKNGTFYWSNGVIYPVQDDSGEITNFLAIQEDVTERVRSEERMRYLASHDEMTGFYNRSRFVELLDEWIVNSEIGIGALLHFDLDQFRLINDTSGHSVGDDYLRDVGRLVEEVFLRLPAPLTEKVKEGYFLGRLGGDEFIAFVQGLDGEEALDLGEIIRRSVEGMVSKSIPFNITVSLGVASYPLHGNNSREMLARADAAKYRAKELGRNRCHLFRSEDRVLEKLHSRLKWSGIIATALEQERFEPWYQPIIDLHDGKIHHYEALARLRDEDDNVLLPGAFIDVAERSGLIGGIDRAITEKTMRLQSEMQKKGHSLTFTMNISGKEVGDEKLLEFLSTKIKETGATPSNLVFEITETTAVDDLNKAAEFTRSLKALGCKFSLDDFGVGFTSFIYLRELHVDFVKIDGSFIRTLDENDRIFVKAITDVAKAMKIKTVAEMVGSQEAMEILKGLGVDYAQGYYIAKPSLSLYQPS